MKSMGNAVAVGFGEIMLRYSPPFGTSLADARQVSVHAGGTEFNVVAAMTKLGFKGRLVTALPDNPLGESARRIATAHGVDLCGGLKASARMGVYYYEPGSRPRPGNVTYDRAASAFARYRWDEADWSTFLPDQGVFFTTGITAALSEYALIGVEAALREAAARPDVFIAFDVNYRSKLWSEEDAGRAISPLLKHVDCLFTARADAIGVLGAPDGPVQHMLQWLAQRFDLPTVAMVYNPTADEIVETKDGGGPLPQWRAGAWHKGELFVYDQVDAVDSVDRIGAGDAFAAGFLTALTALGDVKEALRYGSTLMALKNTYAGDFWPGTKSELELLLQGSGSSVRR